MPQPAGWTFEASLAAFLVMAALAQTAAAISRGRISLPLALGALCAAGLALGILPPDIAVRSRMKEVGVIAFNVLIVHGGTSLGAGLGREGRSAAALVLGASALTVAVLGGALALAGHLREAFALAGPVIGGGAACAIASNAVLRGHPELAVLPWLVFMLQGCFSLPVFAWAIRREGARIRGEAGREAPAPSGNAARAGPGGPPLAERVPPRARGSAYYLGGLMLAAWLNRLLYPLFFARLGLHPALGALLLGILLSRAGLLEREPLRASDSFGLLMLGLMSLMVDTLAASGLGAMIRYAPLAAVACGAATAALALSGALLGGLTSAGPWRGVAAALCAQVGAPGCFETARILLGPQESPAGRDGSGELLRFLESSHAAGANLAAVVLAGLAGLAGVVQRGL